MTLLRNMAIKYKLMTIIMLACITALVLAGAIFIVWEQRMISASMVKNLSTLAEMVGENCKAALTFEDDKDAEKTLEILHVDSSIMFGGIYTNDSKLFAAYYRNKARTKTEFELDLTKFQRNSFGFDKGTLVVASPIILDKKIIGTVCLQSDLKAMHTTLKRSTMIIIVVLILSSLAAFLVSSRLQMVISKPILSRNCYHYIAQHWSQPRMVFLLLIYRVKLSVITRSSCNCGKLQNTLPKKGLTRKCLKPC